MKSSLQAVKWAVAAIALNVMVLAGGVWWMNRMPHGNQFAVPSGIGFPDRKKFCP